MYDIELVCGLDSGWLRLDMGLDAGRSPAEWITNTASTCTSSEVARVDKIEQSFC